MGIFERCRGNTDPADTVRTIDTHAIAFAIFEHAINHEYNGNEAPLATRQNLINIFDLRTDTGGAEGPVSDVDDLDAIRAFYATLTNVDQKQMYFNLIQSTFHLVHSGIYTPAQGRTNLHV